MISTVDWMRYIDSLGSSDSESMRLRLRSAGVEESRAEWLVSLMGWRQIARNVARAAILVLVAGLGWAAYQFWLAVTGAPNAPDDIDSVKSAIAIGVGAVALLISTAVEFSPPLDLLAHPSIPSDLAPPPRRVATNVRASGVRRVLFAAFCLMLLGASLSAPRVRNRTWLHQHGVETTGQITGTFTTKGSKGGVTYFIRYRFDHGEGRQSVSRTRYEQSHAGDRVPVTYLPSRPEINEARTKSEIDSSSPWFDPLLLLPLSILFVFPLIAAIVKFGLRQKQMLAERGVATVGQVTRSGRQFVEYRYNDQTGRFMFGKRRLRERPAEGQPLVILYDPQKPKRSTPLAALNDTEFG